MGAEARPGRVRGDAVLSLGYLVSARFASFSLSVIAARVAGPWGLGAFGIALQLSQFGAMLGGMNLNIAVTRELAAAPDRVAARRVVLTSLRVIAIGGAAAGILFAALARPLASRVYADAALAPVLVGGGVLACASTLYVWCEGALQGARRFHLQLGWGVGVAALDIVLGYFAARRGIPTLLLVRSVIRAAALATVLVALLRARGEDGDRALPAAPLAPGESAHQARVLLRRMFGLSGPVLLANLLLLGAPAILRVFLARQGFAEAGLYQAADGIAQGLTLIPLAAAFAYIPAVSRAQAQGTDDRGASLRRALRRVVGLNLPLGLLVLSISPWVTGLVFGRALGPAGPALRLIAAAAGLTGLTTVFGATLIGRGDGWTIAALNLVWSVVLVLALALGLGHRGAVGAALALGLANVVQVVVFAAHAWPRADHAASALLPPVILSIGAWAGVTACQLGGAPAGLVSAASLVLAAIVFARWAWPEIDELRRGGMALFAAPGAGLAGPTGGGGAS